MKYGKFQPEDPQEPAQEEDLGSYTFHFEQGDSPDGGSLNPGAPDAAETYSIWNDPFFAEFLSREPEASKPAPEPAPVPQPVKEEPPAEPSAPPEPQEPAPAAEPQSALRDGSEPPKKEKPKETPQQSVMMYLHDLVYLICAILLVLLLCFRVVIVSGDSMKNTLVDGDYLLLLSNFFYRDPQQGDIIVASKDSFRDGEPIVKRVIATEGQEVDIDFETGTVYVDGVKLDEPYIYTTTTVQEGMTFPLTVEEGHVFVMGDYRSVSMDSRSPEIGLIDNREILGKAIFLLLPGTDKGRGPRYFYRIGVLA